jgi:hypothetical protein
MSSHSVAVHAALAAVGLRADPAWISANLPQGPVNACAQGLLTLAATCDLRRIVEAGSLPALGPDSACTLPGPFFLQVKSCEDVSIPLEERSCGRTGPHRSFKFLLTDGRQDVSAFELHRIPSIPATVVGGAKLIIKHVDVRRGLLLLTPENTLFVGGLVVEDPSEA